MTVVWTGGWHPLAERFPMLDEEDLRTMAASLKERGQYVPCRMAPDGLGLDGRNRVAACALAGIDPRWEVYEGDPVTFIVEVNAERRHLSTGQRAMAVAIGLADAGKRQNGRFADASVPDDPRTKSRTWSDAIRRAGLVLDHAPEFTDLVLRGDMALDAAYKDADDNRRRRERLEALGSDLIALVAGGVIDLDEAERRVNETDRLEALPDDLADRVRAGTLELQEAELIEAENRERVAAWAKEIRAALALLIPMAGHPIPDDLAEHLSNEEQRDLARALVALTSKEE